MSTCVRCVLTIDLPERVKLPPAPKAPAPPSGMAAEASNALGAAFGIETPHQRAMQAHAGAMKEWRQTCRELRRQDDKAWDAMKAKAAMAPLRQRRNAAVATLPTARTVAVAPTGPARPKLR